MTKPRATGIRAQQNLIRTTPSLARPPSDAGDSVGGEYIIMMMRRAGFWFTEANSLQQNGEATG
jgi:hypothetical protein